MAEASRVVFFDGVCTLCNRGVRFLMARDRHRVLAYAPLQGETYEALARQVDLPEGADSIVYVRGHGEARPQVFVRSEAVLRALHDVGGPWRFAALLRAVPRVVRDALYDWIARHRYGWFGRCDECRVPRPSQRAQILP